ncbi:unnamed protein product [Rodentolepis nana]|uniref:Uncharacterized protein n=1 Tax=Rodentolepis nana TaxID=102285 RepID=A0A3P7T5F4_RODNA|nr:unnamed protein product [Rodentolepis nana]
MRSFSAVSSLQLRVLKEARMLCVRVEALFRPSLSSFSKSGGGGGGGGVEVTCFDDMVGKSRRGGRAGGGGLSSICATRQGDEEGVTGVREIGCEPE